MDNSRTVTPYFTIGAHAIEAHQPVSAAIRAMEENQLRHLPVLQDGVIVGEISERDLRVWVNTELSHDTSISHIMVGTPFVISPGAALKDVAHEMAERKIGCAIVSDGGRLVGMFTVTDALRALTRLASDESV